MTSFITVNITLNSSLRYLPQGSSVLNSSTCLFQVRHLINIITKTPFWACVNMHSLTKHGVSSLVVTHCALSAFSVSFEPTRMFLNIGTYQKCKPIQTRQTQVYLGNKSGFTIAKDEFPFRKSPKCLKSGRANKTFTFSQYLLIIIQALLSQMTSYQQ